MDDIKKQIEGLIALSPSRHFQPFYHADSRRVICTFAKHDTDSLKTAYMPDESFDTATITTRMVRRW